MKRDFQSRGRTAGFTLAEVLVASAVASLMLAAFLSAGISVHRSLKAIDDYSEAQADQVRLSDYVALDLRRAYSVNTTQSTFTSGGVQATNILTLTMPAYYDYPGIGSGSAASTGVWQPFIPYLDKRKVVYGGTNVLATVSYYKKEDAIYRKEVYGARTVETLVASDVADFEPVLDTDTEGDVVKSAITFSPTFQFSKGDQLASREATAIYNRTFLRGRKD